MTMFAGMIIIGLVAIILLIADSLEKKSEDD